MDKLKVDASFKTMHQLLKSVVPPCVASGDGATNYEVWAEKDGQKHLFGSVVAHTHSATVQFNQHIPAHDAKQLFSEYLLHKMNEHYRIDIRIIEDELRRDLQDAIQNLMRYYTDKNWI